ncbi:hypothetical protein JTT07_10000 [Clostridium botulinum]|nr:hypothetical protein [Clostridium botulinum]
MKDQVYVMDSSFNKVTDIDVNINEGKNIIIAKKPHIKEVDYII